MATQDDPFYYFHPSDNVAPNATVTTAGAEDASYPLENAVDLTYANLGNPSKLTGTTGDWIFDFGAAQRIDAVVLWHNFIAGTGVKFEGHTANSWGAGVPGISAAITIPAKRADDYTRKVFIDVRQFSGYGVGGKRYWRLSVDTANDDPIGLKILMFSGIRQLGRDMRWGLEDDENHAFIEMSTDGMMPWAYDLSAAPRVLRGEAIFSDDDAESVREWFRACAGRVKPTVIVPNPVEAEAWLVRWANGSANIQSPTLGIARHTTSRQFTDANDMQLSFEEITAGDPEWY